MKQISLFLLMACIGFFASCSDDDKDPIDNTDYAPALAGAYRGTLAVTLPGQPPVESINKIALTATANNQVQLLLKDFSFAGAIEIPEIKVDEIEVKKEGDKIVILPKTQKLTILGTIEAEVTVSGTGDGEVLNIDLDIFASDVNADFKGKFSGKKIDEKKTVYDMEEWYLANPKNIAKFHFELPTGGWASSNTGVVSLMGLNYQGKPRADKFCVTPTEDSHSGKSAARIETIKSAGSDMIIQKIPQVTAGSLFLGIFDTNLRNTLSSTKFGTSYGKKPQKIKGYFKYKAGDLFLECPVPANSHVIIEKPERKDMCAISAILYEYDVKIAQEDIAFNADPANEKKSKQYRTYLTGENIYDETKYTAIAKLESGDVADYKEFDLDFEYKKSYDPAKSYRLAIIASSSSEGDKFSGAPGSVLYIDDVEIISE